MGNMRKVWDIFVSQERKQLLIFFMIILFSSVLELIGLVLVIPYVNLMLFDDNLAKYIQILPLLEPMLSLSGNYRLDASIWFAAFYCLKNCGLAIMTFIQHSILKGLHAGLLKRMYATFINKPYSFHLQTNSADIIRSLTYDAMHFGDTVMSQGGILLAELLLFIGVVTVLCFQNIAALAVMIVMILPLIIIFIIIKKRLLAWSKILQAREANVIRQLQEGLGGIKDVSVFGVQNHFINNFSENVILRSRMKRNRDVTVLIPRFIIETMMMLGMAVALLWLSNSGGLEKNFSLITFLAVIAVRMLPMSNRIMNSISTIRTCSASIDVIHNYIGGSGNIQSLEKNTDVSEEKMAPLQKEGFFEVNDLCFAYNAETPLLKGLSFKVKKGETIGVVGCSGAGKTTLIDVLLGLLTPSSGTIKQKGIEIHKDIPGWQKRIGYVQQSVFLLDESIAENIAFGIAKADIDIQRVNEVVSLAKLDAWVKSLELGINSKVGERGVSISGGQRQRVGIARALYHAPEILILDEATSALDNRTEKNLMADVYAMKGDRTIILIAHRLETIRQCDNIIVLDQGKIAGVGTFDSLLKENAVFQDISAHAQ